ASSEGFARAPRHPRAMQASSPAVEPECFPLASLLPTPHTAPPDYPVADRQPAERWGDKVTQSARSRHTPVTDSPLPSGPVPGWVGARDGQAPAARTATPPPAASAFAPAPPVAPYVELHAHSAYSFLDGASLPEELAARAAELGYDALALTDHDGVYGSL